MSKNDICIKSLWPYAQLGDGAEKSFRPMYTIMININETNEGVFII